MRPRCFFADRDAGPCDGRLIRAHLVKQQVLKREGHGRYCKDPRSWVWCCGGPTGCGGHHGHMDRSLKVRIPRADLPTGFLAMMEEIGMSWYVERYYPC
jgi:hypothetical protein